MNRTSTKTRKPRTEFDRRVVIALASLMEGEVVSYGDIAKRAGNPQAPRAVGRFLSTTALDLPWWRVVRADGSLPPIHPVRQAELLTAEGVEIQGNKVVRSPLGKFR